MSTIIRELPDSPFYSAMRSGHHDRHGHALDARLVTLDNVYGDVLYRLCCGDTLPPVPTELLPLPIGGDGDRYKLGQLTEIASRDGDAVIEIPVMVLGTVNDERVIVQFRGDDPWRDVLTGEVHAVDILNLVRG